VRAFPGGRFYFDVMILWIVAVLLLALVGMVGFYQGAIRAGISFVGLVAAGLLAMPLGGVLSPVLRLFGLHHPVWLAFIAPFVVYLAILITFKSVAFAIHRKVDLYYKHQPSDTKRLLFERMNQRLGICMGVVNGTVYVFLIGVMAYILGYFTVQASTPGKETFTMKLVNRINDDLKETSFDKAIAPFLFAKESYYDGVDVLGDIFHNPVLQNRLSTYPPFLPLAERPEFKELGSDLKFQEFWLKGPTFDEFKSHPKVGPLLENVDLYTNVVATLGGDFKDLKTYIETGKTEKFGDEAIIGRWELDSAASMAQARRAKPNITTVELRWLRRQLAAVNNATFVAYLDNKARLKLPTTNSVQNLQGTWKSNGGNKYTLSFTEGGRKAEFPASIDGNKLAVSKDKVTLVFDK
jgi:uncharacterized membrane protein required for colicin V production